MKLPLVDHHQEHPVRSGPKRPQDRRPRLSSVIPMMTTNPSRRLKSSRSASWLATGRAGTRDTGKLASDLQHQLEGRDRPSRDLSIEAVLVMMIVATGPSTPETVPPVLEEDGACAAPMEREEGSAEAPSEAAAEVPKATSFQGVAKEPEEAVFLAGLNIIVLPSRTEVATDNR